MFCQWFCRIDLLQFLPFSRCCCLMAISHRTLSVILMKIAPWALSSRSAISISFIPYRKLSTTAFHRPTCTAYKVCWSVLLQYYICSNWLVLPAEAISYTADTYKPPYATISTSKQACKEIGVDTKKISRCYKTQAKSHCAITHSKA